MTEKQDITLAEQHFQQPHHEHPADIELHHDRVAPEAIGGLEKDLPPNYYRSPAFIGTLVATCLAQISGYLGWVLPANTLSLINVALGPSANVIWLAVSWQAGFAVGLLCVGRLSGTSRIIVWRAKRRGC